MAKLLSILLQRSDTSFPWGFQVTGGKDIGTSVTITKVTPKTLAAQYLSPGDIVLEVEKLDSRLLRSTDIETIINRPAKCLDLLIRKSEDNRVNSSNGLHSNADYVDKTNYNNSSKENRSNVFDHSQSNKTASRNQYGSDGINNSFTSNSNNYASDSNSSVYSTTKRTNPRLAKQLFWDRCSQEKKDWGSGFTRFSSFDNNSPYKERLSRNDEWRRRNSEEMTESESYEERYSSETEEYRQHSSGEESLPFRAHSIWSESPMRDFEVKVKKLNRGLSVDNRASSYKNTSSDRRYNRWQSSFEDYEPFETKNRKTSTSSTSQYADSLSDDQFSNLGSNFSFSGASSTLKKPSDFWDEHFRCESFKQKSTPTTPEATETGYTEKTFKKSTEFSRSTSLIEKTAHNSYSDNSGGNKTTVEKVENVSEFEQSSVVDGNNKREEIVKEKENKQEYYLSKYGDKKQERKVQSNYEIMEKRVNDKREFLNKIKNRNEESNTSSVAEETDGGEGPQKIERKNSESEERLNTKQRSDHQQNDNITSYQENNSQQYHNISSNQKDNISQYSTTTKEEKDNIPQYNESTEKDKFPLPEDKDLNILKSSEKDTSQHSKLTEKDILNGGPDKHIPPQLSASLSSTDNNVNSSSDSCCSEGRHVRQNSAERWVTPKGYCKPTSYSSVKPLENSDKDAAPVELKIIEDSDEKSNR